MASPRLLSALLLTAIGLSAVHARAEEPIKDLSVEKSQPVLWTDPGSIRSRNLFYGPGGREGEPSTPVRFLDEDSGGTSPKFNVRDRDGKKWKVKLGEEAQPETGIDSPPLGDGF